MSNTESASLKSNSNGFFITGTDTDCGKTYVSAALIAHFALQGRRVAGLKPIASGFEYRDGQWRNSDIDSINAASSVSLPQAIVNRYAYKEAIAPHIAASKAGDEINVERIVADVNDAHRLVDTLIVEGVGGWLVPLSLAGSSSIETLAQAIDLPVILVVGLRLGCLNHALLSVKAIEQSGVSLVGWVANHVDPCFQSSNENMETLMHAIDHPLLFELPHKPDINEPALIDEIYNNDVFS